MNGDLQLENSSLRTRLETLLHEAQRNQDKMRRFDTIERRLIGAGSLLELIELLLGEYKLAFGVDCVSLALVDRDYEVTRIVESGAGRDLAGADLKLFATAEFLETLYGETRRPWLGRYDAALHDALFRADGEEIASVALIPLVRQGELIGSLHFGSSDAERYASAYATDFLERLAEVVAICVESALSRERLKQAGLTDPLTGVQNRRYFDHRCPVEIAQARRYRHPLACMFIDIDKFKRINDTHGHQSGDAVLRSVANSIQAQLRSGDTIARYGGEEFVVLLPRSELHHAWQIAERIRASVERENFQAQSGHAIRVTISIGISQLPAKTSDDATLLAAQLLASADKALYEAKHGGRNCVRCADGLPPAKTTRKLWRRLVARSAAAWASRPR